MKLGSFEIGGEERLGAFESEWVIDLNAAYRMLLIEKGIPDPEARADSRLPSDLISFIGKNGAALSVAKETLESVRGKDYEELEYVYPASRITFRASHRPPKIVCTGTNYEDYRRLIGIPFSPVPLVFLKSPSAVIGHEETIYFPTGYGIFLLTVGLSGARIFARLINVDRKILTPVIFFLCVVGSYRMRFSFFDVGLSLIIGVIAYFMEYYGYPASPILLALILGPMAEQNLRRSLTISHGDPLIFFKRPISAAFIVIALFVIITFYYRIQNATEREAQIVAEKDKND